MCEVDKVFSVQYENQRWVPRNHAKPDMLANVCIPSMSIEMKVNTGESPEAHGPASLVYTGTSKRPCLKLGESKN